ncbi:TIGR03111 family XrtG-associated glycosyltransferase [Enterococcus gallinarum]|uniref:TIGR03111 family XrtG-associated glycosyltransferase n=1 Tax=Enterococcus gallinarum TaxID=1353 RepID=UPI00214A9EC2|nr:TIGR03111 family XrtG-associated glycosyltransferase [Enterococcus gallinarum]MCR1943399.1 putative glycosyltransferase, exosortase G system-associated [Enterococcus gallinarum]
MDYLFNLTLTQMGFWITWLLIPLLVEIIPGIYSTCYLFVKNFQKKQLDIPEKLPFISVIVPVYNSAETLYACIRSINESTYPNENIQILLADNGSTDESFAVFNEAHNHFNQLNMHWIRTEQGKAQALNSAIYDSIGTYIINIDSDGFLEPTALMNMVLKFENDYSISAMSGTVLTQKEAIKKTKSPIVRWLQKSEYIEYAQSFLAGRNVEALNNQLFTMAGAFSGFRKEVLVNTYLYNTDTVGEDTDMTFQIRHRLKEKVSLCENAIFYVEPIQSVDELYIQRQRWQRGEVEVAKEFSEEQVGLGNFFKNFLVRRLIIDHTFIFPKMIWLFASAVLLFFGYTAKILLLSYLLIYLLYFVDSLLKFISISLLLKSFKSDQRFYMKLWGEVITFPLYNFLVSWFRLIGIINGITSPAKWNTTPISKEKSQIKDTITQDIMKIRKK